MGFYFGQLRRGLVYYGAAGPPAAVFAGLCSRFAAECLYCLRYLLCALGCLHGVSVPAEHFQEKIRRKAGTGVAGREEIKNGRGKLPRPTYSKYHSFGEMSRISVFSVRIFVFCTKITPELCGTLRIENAAFPCYIIDTERDTSQV